MSNTTALNDLVSPSSLAQHIQIWREQPSLLSTLAWIERGTAATTVFGRLSRPAVPAALKAEYTDGVSAAEHFGVVSMTSDSEVLTPGMVGMVLEFSYESQLLADGIPRRALDSALRSMEARAMADLCSVTTTAPESIGSDTQAFDLAFLQQGVHEFMGLRPEEQPVLVCHRDALHQLKESLRTTAASIFVGAERPSIYSAVPGYAGRIDGLDIFVTDAIADNNGAHSNFLTVPGRNRSGLAFASYIPTRVVQDPAPRSGMDAWVLYAYYAVGLSNADSNGNSNILEMQSEQL